MIIDNLHNCNLYYGVNKRFEAAFDFIKKACRENLPVGRYEIDGRNLYAMVQDYVTKTPEDGKLESHRKYIDIQYMVMGKENMEMIDISKAKPNVEYNEEKDVVFYEKTKNAVVATFTEGEYAVFFPHDVHMPAMATDGVNEAIRKIVVKVKID